MVPILAWDRSSLACRMVLPKNKTRTLRWHNNTGVSIGDAEDT